MNSPGWRLMSGEVSCRIHPSNPGDYEPSSRLNLLRSSSARRCERRRLGTIAAIDGWSWEATKGSRSEKRRIRSCVQENENENT
jgi:hypothetical protein